MPGSGIDTAVPATGRAAGRAAAGPAATGRAAAGRAAAGRAATGGIVAACVLVAGVPATAVGAAGAGLAPPTSAASPLTHALGTWPAAGARPVVAGRFTPAVRTSPQAMPAGAPHGVGSVVFDCQKSSAGNRTCYGPQQLRAAYRIQPLLDRGITGAGRTIVIVDAYAPPGIDKDLHEFDRAYGLPDPQLRIVAPQGAVWDGRDPNQQAWASEIDIDVQWTHAIAPEAEIVLVEAKSESDPDLAAAVRYAVRHRLGDVISQSFGEDERCTPPDVRTELSDTYRAAAAAGITVVASSGDTGAGQYVCDPKSADLRSGATFPASDPRVLAVGGTQLTADLSSGAYGSETAWNDGGSSYPAASGGGYSTVFDRPGYQAGAVDRRARGLPDVSYSSASQGAVMVYWGQDGTGGRFYGFFGTSVATAQWSGLVALAAQLARHRLGLLHPTIYRAALGNCGNAVFHDIRTGDNTVHYRDDAGVARTVAGYRAGPGWDAVTGVGSPIATGLVPLLAGAGRR